MDVSRHQRRDGAGWCVEEAHFQIGSRLLVPGELPVVWERYIGAVGVGRFEPTCRLGERTVVEQSFW